MGKGVCILLFFLGITTFTFGQATANSTASATIVTPVEVENIFQNNIHSLSSTSTSNNSSVSYETLADKNVYEKKSGFTIASLKLLNNNYSFGLLSVENISLKNEEQLKLLPLEILASTKSYYNNLENNSSIITITGVLKTANQPVTGTYITTTPVNVILGFE